MIMKTFEKSWSSAHISFQSNNLQNVYHPCIHIPAPVAQTALEP